MTTYLTDSEGKFIPATQRPDGTWRKARRVKEGYVPQEEVPLYESKGKQFANRKSNVPVGMCPLIAAAAKKEREKQQRTKNKQQNGKAVPGILVLPKNLATSSVEKTVSSICPVSSSSSTNVEINNTTAANSSVDTAAANSLPAIEAITKDLDNIELLEDELAKKLKKLKKKIREIDSIESKLKSGELKKPEKDQMDKVKRKKDILKEIRDIEEQTVGK